MQSNDAIELVMQLSEALLVRKGNRKCPECDAIIDDGFDHEETCRHYKAEVIADKVIETMENWDNEHMRHGMTKGRFKELNKNMDAKLTQEEMDNGWIFCNCEWDGMLIHASDPEAEVCKCGVWSK